MYHKKEIPTKATRKEKRAYKRTKNPISFDAAIKSKSLNDFNEEE